MPKIKTDSCGWCKYWLPSGNAYTNYELGTCRRYPRHIEKHDNFWCGDFKDRGKGFQGPSSFVHLHRYDGDKIKLGDMGEL